jgi:hypothetical protein
MHNVGQFQKDVSDFAFKLCGLFLERFDPFRNLFGFLDELGRIFSAPAQFSDLFSEFVPFASQIVCFSIKTAPIPIALQ